MVMDDKETFLSGSRDKSIKLWDVKSGQCIRMYQGHFNTVSIVISLGSKKFPSGSLDWTIRIWSVSGHFVKAIAVMDDRETFLSGSRDKSIKL